MGTKMVENTFITFHKVRKLYRKLTDKTTASYLDTICPISLLRLVYVGRSMLRFLLQISYMA